MNSNQTFKQILLNFGTEKIIEYIFFTIEITCIFYSAMSIRFEFKPISRLYEQNYTTHRFNIILFNNLYK
jgi:hypothetical protein